MVTCLTHGDDVGGSGGWGVGRRGSGSVEQNAEGRGGEGPKVVWYSRVGSKKPLMLKTFI